VVPVCAAAARLRRRRAGFALDTEELFRRSVTHHQTRVRIWTDWAVIAVFVSGLAGGAFWFGQTQTRDEMEVTIRAIESRLAAAILRDGP